MSKKVLAIYYSQSGQLGEIIDNITAPLNDEGIAVDKVRIRPDVDYSFPWTSEKFFEIMPDCVLGIPGKLAPFELKEKQYDLVILGYQAWFLSPCIPVSSLLNEPSFKAILKNTQVVTVTGARNMWLNAFVKLKNLMRHAEARLVGNIALVDRNPNLVSLVTILHWMFKGRKDRYLNIFPVPGVSQADIEHAVQFGKSMIPFIQQGEWAGLQDALQLEKAVEVKYNIMFIESKAGKIFSIWANFIAKRKNKKFWLVLFKYYLFIALIVAAPIILTVDAIFFKPFLTKRIKAKKKYYLELN